jgi:hypothetical protein
LLVLTQTTFAPLKATGEINVVVVGMVDLVAKEGARIEGLNDGIESLSDRARGIITN